MDEYNLAKGDDAKKPGDSGESGESGEQAKEPQDSSNNAKMSI